MSYNTIQIDGGIACILVGLLLPLGHLLNLIGDLGTGTTIGTSAVLIAHAIAVFAFVGVYAEQTIDSPAPVARVGMWLSVLGTVLITAIVFVELAETTGVDTTPVFSALGTSTIYAGGPFLFVVGILIVGATIFRGEDLPRWSGGLLVLGTLVFAAAGGSGEHTPVVTVLGAALTGGGFIWAGTYLIRTRGLANE